MFEECFAMIELNAFADITIEAAYEPELTFSDLTTILVKALEEALFDSADQRTGFIH